MLSQDEYVAKKGLVCPNCGEMPDQRSVEADETGIYANCFCICGSEWVEVYHLTGYTDLFVPEKKE